MQFLKHFSPLFILLTFNSLVFSQQTGTEITFSPEKGLNVVSTDSSIGFKMGFRLQQQFVLTTPFYDEPVRSEYLIRRGRAQFRGFILHGKVNYLIQLGMDKGAVKLLNAEFRWKPDKYTQVSFGQLFPPAGRQSHTISKVFQMVDRSPVSRFFHLGWDMGVRVNRTFPVSDAFAFKAAGSITHGEGMNIKTAPGGWAYTARFDVLPFGLFNNGGDYSESDLFREPSPKLALGTAYYLNTDAYTMFGNNVWDGLDDNTGTFFADFVFKYNGLSLLGEYITRTVDNELLNSGGTIFYSNIISGRGFSIQGGKFISETIEPTFRFSLLNPNNISQNFRNDFNTQEKYTLGLNKFFIGHSIKLQSEIGYVRDSYPGDVVEDYLEFLLQFSLSF